MLRKYIEFKSNLVNKILTLFEKYVELSFKKDSGEGINYIRNFELFFVGNNVTPSKRAKFMLRKYTEFKSNLVNKILT